jgi:hypothetical protein
MTVDAIRAKLPADGRPVRISELYQQDDRVRANRLLSSKPHPGIESIMMEGIRHWRRVELPVSPSSSVSGGTKRGDDADDDEPIESPRSKIIALVQDNGLPGTRLSVVMSTLKLRPHAVENIYNLVKDGVLCIHDGDTLQMRDECRRLQNISKMPLIELLVKAVCFRKPSVWFVDAGPACNIIPSVVRQANAAREPVFIFADYAYNGPGIHPKYTIEGDAVFLWQSSVNKKELADIAMTHVIDRLDPGTIRINIVSNDGRFETLADYLKMQGYDITLKKV